MSATYNNDPYATNTTSTTTTSTTATDTVYTPNPTPTLPPRPVAASQTPDIHTTSQGPAIHSTSSFTTNTGEASRPIDMTNQPLVRPSTGLVHAFKKMTMGGQNRDLEMDPVLQHADEQLQTNMGAANELHSAIQRYQAAQLALQEATVSVARSFHQCLSDEANPYAPITGELMRQTQLHSLVPSHAEQLVSLSDSAVQDTNGAYHSIRNELSARKTKASDVEYYTAKVAKLTEQHEKDLGNGNVKPADKERLDRNIGKMREIELEYNQENERLIADMNALWRRRIIRLGPALSAFIQTNQLVHREQVVVYDQLSQATAAINPNVAHNAYLNASTTMLVPVGSGHVDNRELINAAHQSGMRGEVVAQQRHLEQERNDRVGAAKQGGGSLETVAQETIIRSEEQMRVTKERFVTERVRLRKVVGTEMVTITVPVRKERIEIEREPVNGPGVPVTAAMSLEEERLRSQKRQSRGHNTNTGTSTHNGAGVVEDEEEESYELILSEERPRVVNEVVAIERVRLRKLRQVNTQMLEMDLQREHIDYSAPKVGPGQPNTVTITSGLQTVAGQQVEGFTDQTHSAQVINRPVGTATTTTQRERVSADVDDVEAMKNIGYDPATTGYTKDSTVGVNHPYYNGSTAAPGTTNTFDGMSAQSDLTATNQTVNTTTNTTAPTNRPVV